MYVSETAEAVIKKLRAAMPPLIKPEQIGLCTPVDNGDKYLLGVFVYSLIRDMKVAAGGSVRVDASSSVKTPLLTEARIAVTGYAGKKSGLADDYRLLERVMQIFYDDAGIPLRTAMQPSPLIPAPRAELLNPDADEISKIWQFPGVPYALSLFYKISPIAIPSGTLITSAPVGSVDYAGGGGT